MSLAYGHWEWDGYWRARRDGQFTPLRGHRGPERTERVDVGGTEVAVVPGQCVAWLCEEPAEGLACVKHAEDFAPILGRKRLVTAEDMAQFAHLPPVERERARKRLVSQRMREDPAWRAEANRRKRERRAARRA